MLTADHYYNNYIKQAQGKTVHEALQNADEKFEALAALIPADKWGYSYAPGKWTIKEVVQHIIDSERIFSYRALCIARGEKINLPPFEENDYAANSFANARSGESLVEEYRAVRKATQLLFKGLATHTLQNTGLANSTELTPEELGFIMAGHMMHHCKIIQERYLQEYKAGSN